MKYDFICTKCKKLFEYEKSIKAPNPCCIFCEGKVERFFSGDDVPTVVYPNRPPWTYNDSKKYKNARWNGGPLTKIDPSKHGDIGAWHCPGNVIKEKKKQ